MADLTDKQNFLLGWLADADVSALGECRGPELNALVAAGLAEITPAEGRHEDYSGVSLTNEGYDLAMSRRR